MHGLVTAFFAQVGRVQHTGTEYGAEILGQHIDLVEGQPVVDAALVPFKQNLGKAQVMVDERPVFPAAVGQRKVQRIFVMGDGDQRFDAVLFQLIQHLIVKFQAFFVGGGFVPLGEDAGPGDGKAVYLEAHLSKESDVLFVMMVEIGRAHV